MKLRALVFLAAFSTAGLTSIALAEPGELFSFLM